MITKFNQLDNTNIDTIINESWGSLKDKVENKNYILSSEKTMVFLFAMEVKRRAKKDNLHFDFENQCYENAKGSSKYLDLLFYTNSKFKIAIEFKLPKSSQNGGSAKQMVRFSSFRDLARLNYLKNNSINTKACYFLMATNERSYLKHNSLTKFPKFKMEEGYSIKKKNKLIIDKLPLKNIGCTFKWDGIKKGNNHKNNGKYDVINKYAWLIPIKL